MRTLTTSSRARSISGRQLLVVIGVWLLLSALGAAIVFAAGSVAPSWGRDANTASLTIAVTSVAFAAIHVFPSILPLAFATGVALGWIRERSNSTAPTIVAHVVHNVLVVTFAYATAGWSARLPS